MTTLSNFARVCGLATAVAVLPVGAASAQDFTGMYGGVEGGLAILKSQGSTLLGPFDTSDNTAYVGGVLGFRTPVGVGGRFIVGAEGNYGLYTDGSHDRYGFYGIGGYQFGDRGLGYLRIGYAWLDGIQTGAGSGIDGLSYGGGYEVQMNQRMNLRIDYRYTDFDDISFPDNTVDFDGHEITAGLLFKF